MKVKDITTCLEQWAPMSLQEDYDNCGLLVGDENQSVQNVLITLDITEDVVDEAIEHGCELIVAHHPLIFKGVKKINNKHWLDRCIVKAIKHDICLYAIHTNLDNIATGVNKRIAEKLELKNTRILRPKEGKLLKLESFVPTKDVEDVLNALHQAGAGEIGQYDQCSFQSIGKGTFRPLGDANPTIGAVGKKEEVEETKIELLLPSHAKNTVLNTLIDAHPYEEVAYFLSEIKNRHQEIGSGYFGELGAAMSPAEFLSHLKQRMNLSVVKHTPIHTNSIQRIALCGGAGGFLLSDAIRAGADIFITSDFKYHEYFEADRKITIMDIGHYESEVYTKDLINDFLKQKFANIAFRLSGVVTNPIIYS
jgi:dinuclear metal center YbgI/SA1388 family protein